jgi:hypothetical protein
MKVALNTIKQINDQQSVNQLLNNQTNLVHLRQARCSIQACFRYKTVQCQRSSSHEGHYGTQHTALWSCTHIPNIIDLSRKTKKLWSGQENTI